MLISRWISALVRASPVGGAQIARLGLVFGLARGAAVLKAAAYIIAGMVIPGRRSLAGRRVAGPEPLPLVAQVRHWTCN